jgi:hypothetical protein
MKNGDICLVKTGEVKGEQWRESNFAVAVYFDGDYYSDEVLSPLHRHIAPHSWCITEYVEDRIRGYRVLLNEETIKYLRDE